MDDTTVKKFLRYYWSGIVDFALDIAALDDDEMEAVLLVGRKRMSIERAAEQAGVSVNTMQARWARARKRLCRAWNGIEWISILANTVSPI